ncbi:hypothetical protein D2V17_14265 [Aurantiacibacter xanthus]|uniref:Uncharacterized protein n=1 Tax=Aurantiacibacter xanthus TaxID=1784712 RepID=A0A3A1P1D9_9SPHN|nr:hypothetical protein [Aurantiacibacter xanthus]RIV82963.1 hypothetical protein D2V17_14265 [Aurantiacibacter xanthus]
MSRFAAIDLACNDPDNGLFAGRVAAACCGGMTIEPPWGKPVKFTVLTGRKIRLHRKVFKLASPTTEWVGNWCWNRYRFTDGEAQRLLRTLKSHGWIATDGPVSLCDWWDELA